MARKNAHGLMLSFKSYGKSRAGGRWYRIESGKPVYYGTGSGPTDLESYHAALDRVRQQRCEHRTKLVHQRDALVKVIDEKTLSYLMDLLASGQKPDDVDLHIAGVPRSNIDRLPADMTARLSLAKQAIEVMKNQRTGFETPTVSSGALGRLIDEFEAEQNRRADRREFIERERASGKSIAEAKGENISREWCEVIKVWTKRMRAVVGHVAWDGGDTGASTMLQTWRDHWESKLVAGECSAATFNQITAVARKLIQWAYDTNRLTTLPRNMKALCAKYSIGSSAKSVPIAIIRKLWANADDVEKAWIALGLNCGFYAKDISNLRVDSIDFANAYLDHNRKKIERHGGQHVRYKLWPVTVDLLKRTVAMAGRAFSTREGQPLVRHAAGKKSRVDNVRNHFFRLCKTHTVVGYSFSNLRDSSATWIDNSKHKAFADLFLAHRDGRQARFYVDGKHVNTGPLDSCIIELQRHYNLTLPKIGRAIHNGEQAA